MITYNYGFWEFWDNDPSLGFFGSQKCVFDGLNRLIIVSKGVTELDIKTDVYSDWKEWVMSGKNMMFLPAIRSTGGDPIDTDKGIYTGDIYFLINNWKLVIDLNKVKVKGILYSDNYATAYYDSNLNELYPASVSALVNTSTTVQNVVTGDISSVPTAEQNADAVWQQNSPAQIATTVWSHTQ